MMKYLAGGLAVIGAVVLTLAGCRSAKTGCKDGSCAQGTPKNAAPLIRPASSPGPPPPPGYAPPGYPPQAYPYTEYPPQGYPPVPSYGPDPGYPPGYPPALPPTGAVLVPPQGGYGK